MKTIALKASNVYRDMSNVSRKKSMSQSIIKAEYSKQT